MNPTLLDHTLYLDDRGDAHVVGQVRNDTHTNIRSVRVDGVFYDRERKAMANAYTYALIDILRPDETAPFALRLPARDPPQEIDSYALSTTAMETTDEPFLGIQFVQHNAQLGAPTQEGDPAVLTIIGEVTNVDPVPADEVRVACALYDGEGRIANVSLTIVEAGVLYQSESAPFKVTIGEVQGTPMQYHLLAYGQQADKAQIARQAEIEIVSSRAYTGTLGQRVWVGEVRNVGPTMAQFVRVAAAFYDASGKLLAVNSGFAWRDVLQPEHRSPFQIDLYNPPESIDHWRLWTRGLTREGEIPVQALVLEQVENAVTAEGIASFSGLVHNTSPAPMDEIEIGVTIYGPDAEVISAKRIWLNGALAPDQTMPFHLEVEAPQAASSYTLYAEGEAPG